MSAERIRVAFDHRIFAVQAYGGISRYFAGIVPQLGQHGVEARVVAVTPHREPQVVSVAPRVRHADHLA